MSAQIGKERFGKRLRIGVRFDGTSVVLLNGHPLPELIKGSVAELVVTPESITDENVRASLSVWKSMRFLPTGSLILLGVSPTMIGDNPPPGLTQPEHPRIPSGEWFVEVQINADLHLQVRGDQETRLSPCPCIILALDKKAQSLNHAFTLISELYETKRRSHSGNVFDRGYFMPPSGWWQSLDQLRVEVIGRSFSSTDTGE